MEILAGAVAKADGGFDPLGFSRSGEIRAFSHDQGGRIFKLRIRKPKPGKWLISARIVDFDDSTHIPTVNDGVDIETTVSTREEQPTMRKEYLTYGKELNPPLEVNIPQ